jgi:FtsH-binding integral membrane protein
MIYSFLGVAVFSIYTAYDFQKIRNNYSEGSALPAAMALYLDIFNLFISILRLMMALRRN